MTKLPPYVQAIDGKFRGYAGSGNTRIYGRRRLDPLVAYDDALAMRETLPAALRGLTLEAACKLVLEDTKTKRTAGTVRWYEDHFRVLQRELGADHLLVGITTETVEQYIRDRRGAVKASTVNADLRALHRVFAVALRKGLVPGNPVRLVDRLRADRPAIDFFEAGELAKLLRKVKDRAARDLFVAFAYTGLRRSEFARLEPGHIRTHHIVVAGKNATRVVPIAEDAAAAFSRLVFPVTVQQIDKTFRDWKDTLKDRRWHPHALRHTFATALVRAGERPDVVMRLMGHRDLKTTLRYFHEHGDEAKQAVGRLQLVGRPASRAKRG